MSMPIENSPVEVGSDLPCPAGIATAASPSLNWSESVISTSWPFERLMIRTLIVPAEVSEENSVISSNSITGHIMKGQAG